MKWLMRIIGSGVVIATIIFIFNKRGKDNIIHVGLVGDIMIGRLVNDQLHAHSDHNLWGTMLSELQRHDIIIANLETALTTSNQTVPKVFNFKSSPSHVSVLKKAHIDLVTLANNHVLDFGMQGLEDTLHALQKANIAYVGAGMNTDQARKPFIFTLKGTRFALLGATDNESTWKAEGDKPGTNYISIGDTQFLDDIRAVRPFVDILIVTLHWGPNMREHPSQAFIDYAHAMVDAGADIIAGHSAHILQGIELYRNALIIYDMGDFIDDYAIDSQLRNDLSALFSITIRNNRITKLDIIPARIEHMTVNKADNHDAQKVFDLIKKRSQLFDHPYYEEKDNELRSPPYPK